MAICFVQTEGIIFVFQSKQSESSVDSGSIYEITKQVPRERTSRVHKRNKRREQLLQSSNSSSNDFAQQSSSPRLCNALLNPESQPQFIFDDNKSNLPKSVHSRKPKSPQMSKGVVDRDTSPSDYSGISSSHGVRIPRSGTVRNELSDVFTDNASMAGRFGTNMSPMSRNMANPNGQYGIVREAPESQYCIQFKRVKARRTSSNSQAEYGPTGGRIYDPELGGRERRFRNNHMNDQNQCMAMSSPHMCYEPANMLPQDRGPVKKHVETWLKEAVNRTIQKKNLRRGPMSHVSSGDAQHEPPETGTPQPHSFDGPVPRFPEDIYYNTHYTRTVGKQISSSLHTSTESPHIVPLALTKNSSDAYVPYGEMAAETVPTSKEAKVLGLMFEDAEKLYRRHSAHPMSEIAEHQPEVVSHEFGLPIGNADEGLNYQHSDPHRANGIPDSVNTRYFLASKPQVPSGSIMETSVLEVEEKTHASQKRVIYPMGLNRSPCHMSDSPLRQSRSFSGQRRNSRVFTTASPTKDKVMCPTSDGSFSLHTSRQIHHPGRLTIPAEIDSSLFPITASHGLMHNGQKRGSNPSSIIPGQLSIDSNELRNTVSMGYGGRRYSRHLKPLDAWNSRQSHSMEIVNPHPQHQRSSSSPQRRHQLSKQAAIRKLPAIYSRSLQHSTCSFPAQWGGFLSGPTLSLTSPFDSSSITPDSQNARHFFQNSLDSHEPKPNYKMIGRYGHAHSANESPGYNQQGITISDKPLLNKSFNVLRYSRSSLSPSPYNPETTRKVQSFELNLAHERFPDVVRHSSALLKVHEKFSPLQNSCQSSRRGSSMSNNSMFLPKDCKVVKTSILDMVPQPTPNVSIPVSKPLEKLIPPDLIFSPASRRASMMDDDELLTQNPAISNVVLNDTLMRGSKPIQIELNRGTENSMNTMDQPIPCTTKGSQLLLMSYDNQRQVSDNQHQLRYMQRHKSADAFIAQNDTVLMKGFYSPKLGQAGIRPIDRETDLNPNINLSTYESRITGQPLWFQPTSPSKDMGGLISHCKSLTDFVPVITKSRDVYLRSSMDFEPNLTKSVGSEVNGRVMTSSRNLNTYHAPHDKPINFRSNPMFTVSLANGDNDRLKSDRKRASPHGKQLTPHDNKRIEALKEQTKLMASSPEGSSNRGNIANQGANYLFKSTGSIETCVNPQLLQPSLRPVIDSSEENVCDVCENDSCHDLVKQNQNPKLPLSVSDSHAARRKSFLARYWQHAVQHSGDASLDSFETHHSVDMPAEHQKEQSITLASQKLSKTPHKQTILNNKDK